MDNGGSHAAQDASDVREMLREIGRDVNVNMVYGQAQQLQGRSLIPVAQIHYAGGGGFGGGSGPQGKADATETGQSTQAMGEGRGGGAGLRVTAKPLGMMEVTSEGQRWVPALDYNRLITIWSVLGGVLLVSLARGIMRMMRTRAAA